MQDIPVEKHQGVQGCRWVEADTWPSGKLEKPFHILCPEPLRIGLAAEVMEIAQYPVAIGLLGTVGVVIRAEHLAHLVHQLEAGIRAKFRCIFILHPITYDIISQYGEINKEKCNTWTASRLMFHILRVI